MEDDLKEHPEINEDQNGSLENGELTKFQLVFYSLIIGVALFIMVYILIFTNWLLSLILLPIVTIIYYFAGDVDQEGVKDAEKMSS